LKAGNARVVFVGDSITGLSRNYATGFAHQIEWALKGTYPGSTPDLVALGGSGQGIASWQDVENRSRREEFFLDVPKVGVKSALDRPADVVVIMLGMNDVLAPYVADEPASLDRWTNGYRALIDAIRQRVHPDVTALATITPCTEDPASPKNRMMDRLNRRVAVLAQQCSCRLLRTGESVQEILRQGRRLRFDFHVTYDFVHPNEAGHLAIAIAMLRGLGEAAAARRLEDERLVPLLKRAAGPAPSLSYEWAPLAAPLHSDRQRFRVRYWWVTDRHHRRVGVEQKRTKVYRCCRRRARR
jgi:lysophospholipase L1-like esterase